MIFVYIVGGDCEHCHAFGEQEKALNTFSVFTQSLM